MPPMSSPKESPASSPKESAASSPKESAASSPMLRDLTRARPWYMIGLPNASSRVGPMDHEALPCQVMSCYMMLWYVYLCLSASPYGDESGILSTLALLKNFWHFFELILLATSSL